MRFRLYEGQDGIVTYDPCEASGLAVPAGGFALSLAGPDLDLCLMLPSQQRSINNDWAVNRATDANSLGLQVQADQCGTPNLIQLARGLATATTARQG